MPYLTQSIRITAKHALITNVSFEEIDGPKMRINEPDLEALRLELVGQVYSDLKLSLGGSRSRFVTTALERLDALL
jgi:hypothetical protein